MTHAVDQNQVFYHPVPVAYYPVPNACYLVSVACPPPISTSSSCIYRGPRATFNRQSSHSWPSDRYMQSALLGLEIFRILSTSRTFSIQRDPHSPGKFLIISFFEDTISASILAKRTSNWDKCSLPRPFLVIVSISTIRS